MKHIKTIIFLSFLALTFSCSKSDDSPTPELLAMDIYTCGYESNGTKNVAKVWKKGAAISLTDETNNANAYNCTKYIAKYWKNGNAVSLSDGTNNTKANTVFVSDIDVYIIGLDNIGAKFVAKY